MFEIKVMSKEDVEKVLEIGNVVKTIEEIYSLKAQGNTVVWPTVFHEWVQGRSDMDIKSGYIKGAEIHGLKTVTLFEDNAEKGIPTLIGLIMVFDSTTGVPLGVLDASHITGMRTGAAGAIGAKYLAKKGAESLMLIGAGHQAAYQIAAVLTQMTSIKTVRICDPIKPENAEVFAGDIQRKLKEEFGIDSGAGVTFEACGLEDGVRSSDVIITVTPSRTPLVKKEWVRPGTHFSCIGSDMEGKEEIDPEIFRGARVFVDDMNQCLQVGETEIPVKKGILSKEDIKGEIGQLILGQAEGRQSGEEITIFDATGMALMDLITAKEALDAAERLSLGSTVNI